VSKLAIITGLTGQDGSFLAELLLEKDYEVIGVARRSSTDSFQNVKHLLKDIKVETGDLTDGEFISKLINENKPDEFYNLGAQSFVPVSWKMPEYTAEVNALGPLKVLESIRNFSPDTKFYQASTSEMFGKVVEIPQTETTPFYPRSPYGVAKQYGHWITINYRESYNLFACAGILFNHESERRGIEFVTRKISTAVANIKLGKQDKLYLGNLDAQKDWGYSKDYVEAMWLMLQQDKPDTYVIGTDETHTVREFCDLAFKSVDLDYKDYVEIDPQFFRPVEIDILISNSTKAREALGWKPKTSFRQLVEIMVKNDLEVQSKEK